MPWQTSNPASTSTSAHTPRRSGEGARERWRAAACVSTQAPRRPAARGARSDSEACASKPALPVPSPQTATALPPAARSRRRSGRCPRAPSTRCAEGGSGRGGGCSRNSQSKARPTPPAGTNRCPRGFAPPQLHPIPADPGAGHGVRRYPGDALLRHQRGTQPGGGALGLAAKAASGVQTTGSDRPRTVLQLWRAFAFPKPTIDTDINLIPPGHLQGQGVRGRHQQEPRPPRARPAGAALQVGASRGAARAEGLAASWPARRARRAPPLFRPSSAPPAPGLRPPTPSPPRYELPSEGLKGRVEIKFFDNVRGRPWGLGVLGLVLAGTGRYWLVLADTG
jgi:hypothetical protein